MKAIFEIRASRAELVQASQTFKQNIQSPALKQTGYWQLLHWFARGDSETEIADRVSKISPITRQRIRLVCEKYVRGMLRGAPSARERRHFVYQMKALAERQKLSGQSGKGFLGEVASIARTEGCFVELLPHAGNPLWLNWTLVINGVLCHVTRVNGAYSFHEAARRRYFSVNITEAPLLHTAFQVVDLHKRERHIGILKIPSRVLLEYGLGRKAFCFYIPERPGLPVYHNNKPRVDFWQFKNWPSLPQ